MWKHVLIKRFKKESSQKIEKQAKSELSRKVMNEMDKHAGKGIEKQRN